MKTPRVSGLDSPPSPLPAKSIGESYRDEIDSSRKIIYFYIFHIDKVNATTYRVYR